MASPASASPSSTFSTPSVSVSMDHGREADVGLLPAPAVGRLRSLTFEIPRDKRTALIVRPQLPEPASGSKDDCQIQASQIIPTTTQEWKTEAVENHPKKPLSRQNGTFKLFTGLRKTLSTTSLRGTASRDEAKSPTASGKSSAKPSAPSSPRNPEVRELFQNSKKGACPDLDAVNRALMSLKTTPLHDEQDPYLIHPTRLAAHLTTARSDSRKALLDAMQARDSGKPEVCRAICLSIVHAERVALDTKVYAYNILSTQASPGQALNYLAQAWDLVKQNEGTRADCEKLLGVVALLRDSALERDGVLVPEEKMKKARFPLEGSSAVGSASDGDLWGIERVPTVSRPASRDEEMTATAAKLSTQQPAMVEDFLEVPSTVVGGDVGRDRAMSPRTEKILDWAGI